MPSLTLAQASDLFRRAPDAFLDVGAGDVAYRRVGQGPDVLFVHGWPVSGATFRKLLPRLSRHVTCHVIDFPGAGSSRFDAETPLTVDQHIATVRRVVELLGLDHFAVVGHDSGGLIARHALAGDHRVSGHGAHRHRTAQRTQLALPFVHRHQAPSRGGWSTGLDRRSAEAATRASSCSGTASWTRRSSMASSTSSSWSPSTRHPTVGPPPSRCCAASTSGTSASSPSCTGASTSRCSSSGERSDRFFPVARAEEMAGTFPDARLSVIEGASLFSHEERPAEVAEAMLPVLLGSR